MTLEYDKSVVVIKEQYFHCMREFSGAMAGRIDEKTNTYYLKLWAPFYKKIIENYLSK
jgi:hypothetical protein